MAARLTRAKKKIAAAGIPYVVPADLAPRLDAVLAVVHLLATTGHTAPSGEQLARADLAERALDLARMLRLLLPDEREVGGLLALLLLLRARARDPRRRAGGPGPLALGPALIAEADALIVAALKAGPPGRFTLQAAIAGLHAAAPCYEETDWPQLLVLYDAAAARLALAGRRAQPRGRRRRGRGPEAALAAVEAIDGLERLPLPVVDQGRPPAPPRPPRGGGRGLPRGAAPHRERRPNARSSKLASSGSDPGSAGVRACGRGRSGPRPGARRPRRPPRRPRGPRRPAPTPRSSAAASAAVSTSPAPIGLTTRTRGASIQTGSPSHATAAPAAAAVTTAASAPRRDELQRRRARPAGARPGAASTASSARPCSTPSASPRFGTTTSGYACSAAASAAPAASTTDAPARVARPRDEQRVAVVRRARAAASPSRRARRGRRARRRSRPRAPAQPSVGQRRARAR